MSKFYFNVMYISRQSDMCNNKGGKKMKIEHRNREGREMKHR
jgi:hypothetical protein